MKKLLLSLLCMAGLTYASADTVTWTAADQGYENGQEVLALNINSDISVTADKGSNSGNGPKYYNTGSALRLYGGNTMTITCNGGTISEVVFNTQSSNPVNDASTVTAGYLSITPTATTWTGNASEFTFTQGGTSGHVRIQSIEVTYSTGGAVAVSAPRFTPAAGEVSAGTEVTISCTTAGAAIHYTVDGTEPTEASTLYAAPIVVNEAMTIKAVAYVDGTASSVVEAAYTIKPEAELVANIAAWLAKADEANYVAISNPVTVVKQAGQRLFVQDATGALLIYGTVGQTYDKGAQIPAGFAGKYTVYNGTIEMVPDASTFAASTSTADVVATSSTVAAVVGGQVAQATYVKLENVDIDATAKTITAGDAVLPFYNQFNITINDATGVTVYGIVTVYNEAFQLYPVEIEGEEEPPTPPATEVENIAAWLEAANTAENVTITNPVTAVYQNGKNLYIKDNSGWVLVYGDLGKTYVNGNIIPGGIAGKYSPFNGLPEMVPDASTFGEASEGDAVEPTVVYILDDVSAEPLNSYIEIPDVTIGEGEGKAFPMTDVNETTMTLYNTFNLNITPGEGYTVRGFVAIRNDVYQVTAVEVVNGAQADQVSAPTFNVPAGDVLADTEVMLATQTAGADIYYTLDGTEPTTESNLYAEPIVITETVTIKAKAVKDGMEDSEVVSATYTLLTPVEATEFDYYRAPQATEPEADDVVALINADGSESTEDAQNPEQSLDGKTFEGARSSISFAHGTGNYYSAAFGNQVRLYNGETMNVAPKEGYKIVNVYINTVANSKGNVTVTNAEGATTGVVVGSGSGAANPITWFGETAEEVHMFANAQVRFNYITVGLVSLTGIENVAVEEAEGDAIYYNLHGVRVANPTAGIYVKVCGNKASKVLVK